MIKISFDLENQLLRRTDTETIVNKSRNIVQATFNITGDLWDNVDRFVIFKDAWNAETIVHLSDESEVTVIVPSACMEGRFFKVTLFGGDLITTNEITIPLLESGYDKAHTLNPKCDYTKDVFVELFEELKIKFDDVQYADDCLHFFSDGQLVDSISIPGVQEEEVIRIVNEQLVGYMNREEIEAFLAEKGYISCVYMNGDDIVFE